jgi:hypothetical protein
VGIRAKVVNARHVKNVPGRKTDVGDAHWLARLARSINHRFSGWSVSVASVPSCGGKELFSDGGVVFAGAEVRSLRL